MGGGAWTVMVHIWFTVGLLADRRNGRMTVHSWSRKWFVFVVSWRGRHRFGASDVVTEKLGTLEVGVVVVGAVDGERLASPVVVLEGEGRLGTWWSGLDRRRGRAARRLGRGGEIGKNKGKTAGPGRVAAGAGAERIVERGLLHAAARAQFFAQPPPRRRRQEKSVYCVMPKSTPES